jgi:hypothetical protein
MPVSPLERKQQYVENLASEDGINLSIMSLLSKLDLLNLSIAFNVLFRFYMDMLFNINLGFDFNLFDWFKFDFRFGFEIPLAGELKGRYDISKYGECIYDPPEITARELERLSWFLRKHTTETSVPYYKSMSNACKLFIETYKDIFLNKGFQHFFLDAIELMLSYAEGKTLNGSYVGFAVVGLSKVMKPSKSQTTVFVKRDQKDWKTEVELETVTIYGCHVGYAVVGYSRVGSLDLKPKKEMADMLKKQAEDFQKRTGITYQYDQPVCHQRVFMLPRVDRYHWKGGEHQISMQNLINIVKKILDEEGVVAQFRMAYLNFAHELYYLEYEGHRLFKRYKKVLTVDDLINKYLNIGLNINILNKIKGVIKP